MNLETATNGVCRGHRCDYCPRCVAEDCCGADVYEKWHEWPEQGSWPDTQGELGAFELDDAGRLKCHVCGRFYRSVAQHAAMSHEMDADTYRAYFGFALNAPLVSAEIISRLSENGQKASQEHKQALKNMLDSVRPSREQMSVISYRRESRAELKPKRDLQLKGISAKGLEALRIKRMDPIFSGKVRASQIRAARRHKLYDQRCPYCGYSFCAIRYRGSPPITCRSADCMRKAKQAAQRKARNASVVALEPSS